jgi:hypothetical protein
MNTKNLWIASLSGAALSLLVSNLPVIGLVNCLLFAGFWGSAIFAVWLYRRMGSDLTISQGIKLGALTGLLAGLAGILLSFIGLAGLQGFVNSMQLFLPADATQSVEEIPAWGALIFNLVGVILEVVFGSLGGWIGTAIFHPRRKMMNA